MARPRKSAAERSKPRQVWAPDTEWADISRRAAAAGMRRGPYILRAALDRRIVARPGDVAIARWRELGQIGNNVNQIAKALNADAIFDGRVLRRQIEDLSELLAEVRSLLLNGESGDDRETD